MAIICQKVSLLCSSIPINCSIRRTQKKTMKTNPIGSSSKVKLLFIRHGHSNVMELCTPLTCACKVHTMTTYIRLNMMKPSMNLFLSVVSCMDTFSSWLMSLVSGWRYFAMICRQKSSSCWKRDTLLPLPRSGSSIHDTIDWEKSDDWSTLMLPEKENNTFLNTSYIKAIHPENDEKRIKNTLSINSENRYLVTLRHELNVIFDGILQEYIFDL